MTISNAWREGMRRVNSAPAVLAGVWLMTILVSLPLALDLRDTLQRHLGSSLEADKAASGVNYDWMQEFADQATGIGTTFKPTIIGFGATLDNLSAFLDGTARPMVIVAAAGTYVLLWMFVAGGIIDRYARDRATRAHGFFPVSSVFFVRFLRLAIVAWAVYALLFAYIRPLLLTNVYDRLTHDLPVERTAFFIRLGLYLVFGVALASCNLAFDYAKVRAVVEDRRSMLGALRAALRFLGRHWWTAALLYLLDMLMFVVVIGLYGLVAPGAGSTGWSMWFGFIVGQAYLLARLWVKLVFWASETALFQSRLAHAGYVAAPAPAWPDSPAAEAILRT